MRSPWRPKPGALGIRVRGFEILGLQAFFAELSRSIYDGLADRPVRRPGA